MPAYDTRFGLAAGKALELSALYPGYGPLAESAAAIQHFRRAGVVFVGPTQDVVERAGDKRRFRALARTEAPDAVSPGIELNSSDPKLVMARIGEAHAANLFQYPDGSRPPTAAADEAKSSSQTKAT